jgi:Flp pilus assembly protein TadG
VPQQLTSPAFGAPSSCRHPVRLARNSGQSLIEVTVGIIVLVMVALVLIDLAVILFGVQLNDANCRNAAGAAAEGNPAEAASRAATVIDHANARANAPIISHFHLVLPVETKIVNQPKSQIDVTSGTQVNPGGAVTGTVGVTTEVEVRPFLVHYLVGGKSPLTFKAHQSAPINYVVSPDQPAMPN